MLYRSRQAIQFSVFNHGAQTHTQSQKRNGGTRNNRNRVSNRVRFQRWLIEYCTCRVPRKFDDVWRESDEWFVKFEVPLKILLAMRLFAAFLVHITDCDETFNYWEPVTLIHKYLPVFFTVLQLTNVFQIFLCLF